MNLSILIPSNKPIEQYAAQVIDSVNTAYNDKYSYELLFYHPDDPSKKYQNTRFFKEIEEHGIGWIYHELYKQSAGEVIIASSDGTKFPSNMFEAVDYVLSDAFADKKFRITSFADENGLDYGLPEDLLWVKNLPQMIRWTDDFKYNKFHIVEDIIQNKKSHVIRFTEEEPPKQQLKYVYSRLLRWPVITRETIENEFNGYVFNPYFKRHFLDNWNAYFVSANGQITYEYKPTTISTIPHEPHWDDDTYDRSILNWLVEHFDPNDKTFYSKKPDFLEENNVI